MSVFNHLLANALVANVTNFTVWFAVTFWVYLETKSVAATGFISGLYLVLTAALAIWFGSLVDHHRKRLVMLGSSLASLALYAAALLFLAVTPEARFTAIARVELWIFIGLVMLGVIAGNLRSIALPTLVTVLIPEDRRDKANGLVGMVTGIGFVTTSVISGFLVARGGMLYALTFAIAFTVVALVHLLLVKVEEPSHDVSPDTPAEPRKVDLVGTVRVILAVPGLIALILFATFNNLLGGVFMALLDAYGLTLLRVEQWGMLWAVVSTGFILSGLVIARTGLGPKPLRTLLLVNLIAWSVASVFTIQSSVLLLGVGCFIWQFLWPFAEAAEQTTLQKVVPYERQGRVFGFAQSVEQAASPAMAFLIAPIAEIVFIPLMTTGAGADAIGDWFGRGSERGLALIFTLAGLAGVVLSILALNSKSYRRLSAAYAEVSVPLIPANARDGRD